MENLKQSQLDEVKAAAERLTLRRIRQNAEEQGLPVPPRAAHGDKVLPKVKVEEVKTPPAETEDKPKKHMVHMNKAELQELAKERGVEVDENATNEELRAALKKGE